MRHRKAGIKLSRTSSHRDAMFRNMVTSLLKYERIQTTDVKAKELRRWADHIITLAKRGDLHARRQALAIVREKDVVHKLFEVAGQRFGSIKGGYTRVVKIGRRPGDAAPVSLIELVVREEKEKQKKKKPKSTAPKQVRPEVKVEAETGAGQTETASEKAETLETVTDNTDSAEKGAAAEPKVEPDSEGEQPQPSAETGDTAKKE